MTMSSDGRKAAMDGFGVLVMIGLTLSWGLNTVVGKFSIRGVDPMFLSFLRAVIAIAALYVWCRFRGIPVFVKDGSLKSGVIVGLLFGFEFAFIYYGLDLTSASRANLMVNTMPFFTLIGAHFLLGERATPIKVFGTLLSFAGVAMVFFDHLSLPSPQAIYGDLLCLAGGAAWAATALVIRRTKAGKIDPVRLLLYQLAGAALVSLPFLPFSTDLVRDLDGWIVAAILFQALYIVAFTYGIWFWMIARYPLNSLSSFMFLSPVFGVMFGGLLLNEPLTAGLLGGMALVVMGLMLVNGTFTRRSS